MSKIIQLLVYPSAVALTLSTPTYSYASDAAAPEGEEAATVAVPSVVGTPPSEAKEPEGAEGVTGTQGAAEGSSAWFGGGWNPLKWWSSSTAAVPQEEREDAAGEAKAGEEGDEEHSDLQPLFASVVPEDDNPDTAEDAGAGAQGAGEAPDLTQSTLSFLAESKDTHVSLGAHFKGSVLLQPRMKVGKQTVSLYEGGKYKVRFRDKIIFYTAQELSKRGVKFQQHAELLSVENDKKEVVWQKDS